MPIGSDGGVVVSRSESDVRSMRRLIATRFLIALPRAGPALVDGTVRRGTAPGSAGRCPQARGPLRRLGRRQQEG